MTEKEPILVSCPGCRTMWQLLGVDGDRQTWGWIGGFAGDEVSLYGSPVKGNACWKCAPVAAAKALGDQAVDYIAERSDVFYRLLRTFTESGLDAQEAAEHRAEVIKLLLEDPEFRAVTTDYLREDGRGWDEKIRDEFT